jgi:hypothetical protein
VEEIEQEKGESAAVTVSDAFWIRLNEVVPSGEPRTTRRQDRPAAPAATPPPRRSPGIYASSRARLSIAVILIGGKVNAEMEHQTARDTTKGAPEPIGA